MRKLNNNGYTLVELLITIVLLSLILSIAGYSIVTIVNGAKEKNYETLINNIKSASEMYYQECRYMNNEEEQVISCEKETDGSYEITLYVLLEYGFLSSSSNHEFKIINPKDNKDIANCKINITSNNSKVVVTSSDASGSCPTEY